jgi:enoyl-CoA hydratase/isomerase-like protein
MGCAEADEAVRVVVVTGDSVAFSSGFDLKEQMERRPTGFDEWRAELREDFGAVTRFWHCPKPTLAAVRGPYLAGAIELMLACDMTIAGGTAFFGEPELKFGAGIVVMLLPGWSVRRSPRRSFFSARTASRSIVRANSASSIASSPMTRRGPKRRRSPGIWRRSTRICSS